MLVALAVTTMLGCTDGGPAPSSPSALSGTSSPGASTSTIDVENPPGGRLESAQRSSGFKPSQCYTVDGFSAGQSLEPTQLHAIACNAPHRLEVDAVLQHPSAESIAYPGDDALASFGDDQCLDQFRGYVGETYERSSLDIADIRPTRKSWNAGDRTVVCFVYDQDFADLTASVKGSRK